LGHVQALPAESFTARVTDTSCAVPKVGGPFAIRAVAAVIAPMPALNRPGLLRSDDLAASLDPASDA